MYKEEELKEELKFLDIEDYALLEDMFVAIDNINRLIEDKDYELNLGYSDEEHTFHLNIIRKDNHELLYFLDQDMPLREMYSSVFVLYDFIRYNKEVCIPDNGETTHEFIFTTKTDGEYEDSYEFIPD